MTAASDGGLRPLFQRHVGGHWQVFQQRGVPDSSYCAQGAEGFVEFKQTHAWAVKFRIGQVAWIMRRARAGGRVFVATRRWPTQPSKIDELWVTPGAYADLLARDGLRGVAAVSLVQRGDGPRNWDWSQVRLLLSSTFPVRAIEAMSPSQGLDFVAATSKR